MGVKRCYLRCSVAWNKIS